MSVHHRYRIWSSVLSYGPWYQLNMEVCGDRYPMFHQMVLCAPSKSFSDPPFEQGLSVSAGWFPHQPQLFLIWLLRSHLHSKLDHAIHAKSSSSSWTSFTSAIASNSVLEKGKNCTMAIHCRTIPWSLCCIWHQCLCLSKISARRMTSYLQVSDWNKSAFCGQHFCYYQTQVAWDCT